MAASIDFKAIAQNLGDIFRRTDVSFAIGILLIMVVLLMPMPKPLMDFALALSITFSVMILMTSLFIMKPDEFSSFPTVLLIATMIRLSLNVASTRLILSHGHEGTSAAGKVIEAFGQFVVGGNFVIGIVVFIILIIVNFVVITKGSGRIAEVAARFSLDGMPGKQMAIDADLAAGMIDESEARKRRKAIESESNFYGAMDGAAKFVRGDAIAGLLITFINVIGGVIIGVAQNNMSFGDAFHTYTLLTVGDGLVTQIPALIVSMASGLLVSKAGIEGATDKALYSQLSAYPTALGMASFVMAVMGMLPGIPITPFVILASLAGYASWNSYQEQLKVENQKNLDLQAKETEEVQDESQQAATQVISLPLDMIRLELGYGLLSLLNGEKNKNLGDQIKNLRTQLQQEMGIYLPSVRIQDNMQLGNNEYLIRIKELEAGKGHLKPGELMVMDPGAQPIDLRGEHTREPSFGLPAMWIAPVLRTEAENLGYTIVDPSVVLTTHLTEVIKDNIGEMVTFADVQKLLDDMNETYKKLLNDIVPGQITVGGIQRVLQNLVGERISIRDLPTILEGIAEACNFSRNIATITEHLRLRLSRQITFSNADQEGVLNIVTLSPQWEQIIGDAIVGDGEARQLALSPSHMQEFIFRCNETYDRLSMMGEMPALVTTAYVRSFVRSILERVRPAVVIMSQNEVHPKVKIRSLGQLE
ncbi:MAG: flagellar biosynthesis protein FlhA [Pseudomonadota bacterium]|jgi:flagellar biosynthesis protein FlhA|nr:flagellar biosynthesis protein FlhA [Alphaproteobacteria bacterium]